MAHRRNPHFARGTLVARAAACEPPVAQDVQRSPGQPLDSAARAFMEPRFGHDFSRVRIHSDARASDSAQAVDALAYTVGRDIFFRSGAYRPDTSAGRHLLAHELVHVLQQGSGQAHPPQAHLQISPPGDVLEQEAERTADRVVRADAVFAQQITDVSQPDPEKAPFTRVARPLLQRTASFVPGRVLEVNNLAEQVAQGREAGYTPPYLNSRETISDAGAMAAINRPIIRHRSLHVYGPPRPAQPVPAGGHPSAAVPDPMHAGLVERYRSEHGIPAGGVDAAGDAVGPSDAQIKYGSPANDECWVESVPQNTGSFEEDVLTNSRWRTISTRANLLARILRPGSPPGGLADCARIGSGNALLDVFGHPSNAELAASTRSHEDHHAADHERVFNAILVPWDAALSAAQASRRVFRGASAAESEAALFAAMGGTPDEVAVRLMTAWRDAGAAFHATPAGRSVVLLFPSSDAACTNVTVIAA